MPIRYNNLSSNPSVLIVSKKIVKSEEKCTYLCIKATFGEIESNYTFGRTSFKVVLSDMTNDAYLGLFHLSTNYLTYINENTIGNYIDEQLSNFAISKKDETYEVDVDISSLVSKYKNSNGFTLSFAIRCYSEGSIEINIENVTNKEVLIGEVYNNKNESYLHETISQDLGFVGSGKVDLYTQGLFFNFLDITTSGKNPVSLKASYNGKIKGAFGQNGTSDYEYKIKRTNDYIELINYLNDSYIYLKMTKEEAKEKYHLEIDSNDDLYVNISDYSYILNNGENFSLIKKNVSTLEFECPNIVNNVIKELYLLKIILDKYTITYIRNGSYRVTSIIGNDEDKITITYDNYANIKTINYDNRRYIKFTYKSISNYKLLSKVEYCDNNNPTEEETIQNVACFEYDNSQKLVMSYDEKTNIGCKYEYTNSKITRVSTILKDTEEYSEFTEISTNDGVVTLKNNLDKYTYYYFDEKGRCYLKVDDEGNTVSTIYDESTIGANAIVVSETNPQINDNNILLNGDFEGELIDQSFSWVFQSLRIKKIKNDSIGYNGKNSLMINNDTEEPFSVYQTINNTYKYKNKKLFLKGYVRGEGNVNINVKIDGNDNIVNFDVKNIWEEVAINDIDVSDSVSTIKVVITLESNTKVRLSNFSLCVGGENQRYNYIQNGKFVDNIDKWKTNNFDGKDLITPISNNEILNKIFTTGLKITGNLNKIKEIKQEIKLSGGAGEELLFSFFKKANLTLNDICYAYMEISYTILGNKTYSFKIGTNVKEYEKVIQSIITESSYNKVTVGVKYLGKSDLILTDFGLFKEEFGNYYSFTENKALTEIASGANNLDIEYSKKDKVKRITSETGEVYEYTYDDLGNIILITDSSGNSFSFEYDENYYLNKNKITTINGKTLEKELINDSKGNIIKQIDYDGNITMYEYDDKNRIKILNHPNGEVEHYKYDNRDNIVKKSYDVETTIINHEFSYDNINNMKSLNACGEIEYKLDPYDSWQNFEQVKLNNKVLNKFNYYKRYDFYTGQLLSKEYTNGTHYYFSYDELLRLTKVEYEASDNSKITIATYEYDKYNKLIKKGDIAGVTYYSYNANGLLIKEELVSETTNKCIITEYDNLENIQQKSINIDGKILNYNYVYDYEYNEYQSGGYFSRLENSFNEDIIFEEPTLKYGEEPILNTIETVKDVDLNRNILRFTKDTSTLSYSLDGINAKRIEKTAGSSLFNKEEWNDSFAKRKEIIMWIRVNNLSSNTNEINILSFGNETEELASLKIKNTGEVKFSCNGKIIDNMDIKPKEWNLIGISLERIDDSKINFSYFVNEYLYETPIETEILTKANRLSFGSYQKSTVTNEDLIGGDSLEMPFDILYVGIGEYQHTKESYKGIYNEGYKYLFTKTVNKQSGVIYYNHSAYEGVDVIPLNGSLTSIKGLKPLEYTYGDSSFKIDKTKLFKLDKMQSNVDNTYTSRHTYASYNEEIGISGKNKSMLSYDLGLEKEGVISLRFKCDYVGGWSYVPSRTILACPDPDNGAHKLLAYVDNASGQISISFGGKTYYTGLNIIPDTWHHFTVSWTTTNLVVYLDGNNIEYLGNEYTYPDLTNCKTYIGCNYLNNKPCLQLLGSIEMLIYSNKYIYNIHPKLVTEGQSISILTEYDEIKRPIGKEINTGTTKLNQEFVYNDDNQIVEQMPSMEILPTGEKIVYSYDRSGNITHKVKIKNETIEESINYQYDISNRLIKEKCYNGSILKYNYEYKYNSLGDILEKIEYNISDEIISKEIYNYSTTNGSQLLSINKVNTNNEIIETKTITYLEEDPFRPKTYKNNNLTWNGKRLTSYGTNTYKYNSEGIRISKTTSEGEYKYLLDGNKIIKEIKPNNKEIYYHYDEKEELVGFNYNAKEYFYIRDITGNITNIIDSNGTIKVSYEYDAWGKVINIDGDEDLIEINSYLYKGYYYDKETSLYYCNSRYYDPEIRRWISIDDIDYLDIETINGVNLYAYCMNNPVMCTDPTGHMPKWLATTLKIVGGVAIIAGCVAGSILTGGALSVVLAGAAIGAASGGISAGVSTVVSGGDIHDFANAFLMSTASGAISGAVAASPLGTGAQMAINAALSAANYAGTQLLSGNKITLGGLVINAGFGAICGKIGQKGWMQSEATNAFIGFSGKNAMYDVIHMVGEKSLRRMILPTIAFGGAGGGIYGRISSRFNPNGNFIGI